MDQCFARIWSERERYTVIFRSFNDGPMFCTYTWSERENKLNHVITTNDTVIFRSFNDRIFKVLMKYKGWLSDVLVYGGKINAYLVGICMNKQSTRVPLSLQKWSKFTLRESLKNLVTLYYLETFCEQKIFFLKKDSLDMFSC